MSTKVTFRKIDTFKAQPFEAASLVEEEKERLCRDLLSEFGVTKVHATQKGELQHSCCLPNSSHKNGDASASASLNYKKLTYACLGCGSSGGLLWFIATCRGEDSDSARSWLQDQTGTGADEQSLSSLLSFFDSVYGQKVSNQAVPIPKMSTSVLTPWRKIHPYMTEDRGISVEALIRFQVGYAADYRTRVGEDDEGKPVFIKSERIIIPHFWKGELVGWQTRRLINDGTPKYVSSGDFPKDTTIYNFDAKATTAVVVESPLSVLASADDTEHYEGTFGAKVTDRQAMLLSIHQRLIFWMDNDEAGWKATRHLAEITQAYSDVWVVDNPWNADPADLPCEERRRLVNDPVPWATWTQPSVLFCWGCKQKAHEGVCS